ncbi:MAG: LysE family translocator [Pseudomonadota bacterium]
MHAFSALLGMFAVLALGTISPGPSFVMVARTAVSASRGDGIAAALGMGAGAVVFATAALLGLNGLLLAVPTLYLALKVAGGLYLAWMGVRIWLGARRPLVAAPMAAETSGAAAGRPRALRRSFVLGLSTQLSNPKTALAYASVFAAFLPAAPSPGFGLAVVACVFVLEASWYTVVAAALSASRSRGAYLRCKTGLDRAAGGVMVALGLRLAWSAR